MKSISTYNRNVFINLKLFSIKCRYILYALVLLQMRVKQSFLFIFIFLFYTTYYLIFINNEYSKTNAFYTKTLLENLF